MTDCPYCLTTIDDDAPAVSCDACGAVHHAECWEANGGCCVRNCRAVRRTIELDEEIHASGRLDLSRESVEAARPHRSPRVTNPCMACGRQVPEGELYCLECTPGPPENEDTRNAGPLMLMLGIIATVFAWLLFFLRK